jgi:hypothetical protein
MRPLRLLSLLLIGLLLPLANAQAVTVNDLHTATVEVIDKSEKARTAAFRKGLEQVLVKMAGSAAVLDRGGVDALLERPNGFVQRYRYEPIDDDEQTGTPSDAGGEDGGAADDADKPRFRLIVTYAGGRIEQRLEESDVVVWGEERPEVLVWLAIDDGRNRRILGTDGDSEAYRALMDAAERRALPILLPLMDMRDRERVEFVDISGGFFDTLGTASERYRGDIMLVGHLRRGGGGWRGDWTLIGAGERRAWGATADAVDTAVATGVDGATERLAAMLAGEGGERTRLSVRIDGVGTLDDYARVKEYIDGLVRIRSSSLRGIQPGELVFDLEVRGDIDEFERAVALGNVLEKVERRERSDSGDGAPGNANGDSPANGDGATGDMAPDAASGQEGSGPDGASRPQVVFRLVD